MTEDERKQKMNEYSQICAQIGDLETTKEFMETDIFNLKLQAKEILQELRVQKPV